MPRLYNQTNKHLSWTMSGVVYACAPFDHVDVPAAFVDVCKSRQLPLGVVPIAPETKAKVAVTEEQAAARADALRLLGRELDEAKAEANTAKVTAENLQVQLVDAKGDISALTKSLEEMADRLRVTEADKEGLSNQLKETASKLQFAEDFIEKAKVEKMAAAEVEAKTAGAAASAKASSKAPPAAKPNS